MNAQQIVTLAMNPETCTQMEIDIFGRLARIHEQQTRLDADLEDTLATQRLVQIVKHHMAQDSAN